jgi:hypothetical protein
VLVFRAVHMDVYAEIRPLRAANRLVNARDFRRVIRSHSIGNMDLVHIWHSLAVSPFARAWPSKEGDHSGNINWPDGEVPQDGNGPSPQARDASATRWLQPSASATTSATKRKDADEQDNDPIQSRTSAVGSCGTLLVGIVTRLLGDTVYSKNQRSGG